MVSRRDQLNVPLDADLKERWKQWAMVRGLTLSALIEGLALACVEGRPLELPGVEVSAPTGQGLEDLKKSILAELSPIIRGEVEKAITELTPPAQIPEMDQVVATFDNASNTPKEDDVTIPIQTELIGGDDLKIPDWLESGKEYEQNDFARLIGCDPGTVTKVFKGDIKRSRKADLNVLLSLKESGKLTQTDGGKWTLNL
jgi:hypothetical protein